MIEIKIFFTLLVTAIIVAILSVYTIDNAPIQRLLRTLITIHVIIGLGIILHLIWTIL